MEVAYGDSITSVATTTQTSTPRAALVMVIIATLVALSPFQKSPAWQDSHGQVWLGQALELLKPVLPERLNIRFAA